MQRCSNSARIEYHHPTPFDTMKACAAALLGVAACGEKRHKHNRHEDYKDDVMPQGKAMHAIFAKSYEAFEITSHAFSRAPEAETDKRQLAKFAQVEKAEGSKFRYWHMPTMMAAKQWVNVIEERPLCLGGRQRQAQSL
ncbi:MAG: DUF3829 domain-containing protein [Comamonas sp.]